MIVGVYPRLIVGGNPHGSCELCASQCMLDELRSASACIFKPVKQLAFTAIGAPYHCHCKYSSIWSSLCLCTHPHTLPRHFNILRFFVTGVLFSTHPTRYSYIGACMLLGGRVLDATGAGDAFRAAFAVALAGTPYPLDRNLKSESET